MQDRTKYVGIGLQLGFIGLIVSIFIMPLLGILVTLVALTFILIGSYQWTREKDRHRVFMFWGLLAPIGLFGIVLLRYNCWENSNRKMRIFTLDYAKNSARAMVRRGSVAGYQDRYHIVLSVLGQNLSDMACVDLY
jgi:hypothetical protein